MQAINKGLGVTLIGGFASLIGLINGLWSLAAPESWARARWSLSNVFDAENIRTRIGLLQIRLLGLFLALFSAAFGAKIAGVRIVGEILFTAAYIGMVVAFLGTAVVTLIWPEKAVFVRWRAAMPVGRERTTALLIARVIALGSLIVAIWLLFRYLPK